MKKLLLIAGLAMLVLFTSCNRASREAAQEPLEILFIGNSYTFYNDLPAMFASLAEEGGHKVNVTTAAKGGYSLAKHVDDEQTTSLLEEGQWDYVILQEKSSYPVDVDDREQYMYPAVKQLDELVREQGGESILFITWGHRDGMPQAGLADYQAMQSEIIAGYTEIAEQLDIRLAPVGLVWQKAQQDDPGLKLWIEDGSHPSPLGSFLAADVFYAVIFQESSPSADGLGVDLDPDAARLIQEITAALVLRR